MEFNEALLRKIINEEVRKLMDEFIISEMAFSLSEYRHKASDRIPQIVINWCLVRYARYDEKNKKLRNHWATELVNLMHAVSSMSVKKGNDVEKKQKALYGIFSDYEVDRNEGAVSDMISDKFEIEGIDTYSESYIRTVSDFISESRNIVNAMVTGNRANVFKYVRTI